MLSPRDYVGIEYYVTVQTTSGVIHRCVIALDREDALAQVLNYCDSEGLTPESSTVL